VDASDRAVVFITHANPEDNPFAIWLGAKLASAGYEVWADVLRLRGGHDWQRLLEDTIRLRTFKLLLVANEFSVKKQGVRNELQIASDTGKKLNDSNFIIPLRLGAFETPFVVAEAQYINFEQSWASGLKELLDTLQETYKVPKSRGNAEAWMDVQLIHGKKLAEIPERLLSNWLEVKRLPTWVYFYPNFVSVAEGFPKVEYREGALTCVKQADPERLASRTADLLRNGWPAIELDKEDARRRFADIANQALANLLKTKNLGNHQMGNRQFAWWVTSNGGPQAKVAFDWPECRGSRLIQGISNKRKVRWHFGVSVFFRSAPFHHYRVTNRLIFTQDGKTPIDSAARAHRLRRSFAKGWRNARWRDMLLSFLYWLTGGKTELPVPVATGDSIVLVVPPLFFDCPVGVADNAEQPHDEDDPDVDTLLTDEDLEDAEHEQQEEAGR